MHTIRASAVTPPTTTEVVEILERIVPRFTALLRNAGSGSRPVPHLEWTVGETAAHVWLMVSRYPGLFGEQHHHMRDIETSGIANTEQICSISERNPATLADMIERDTPTLINAFRAHSGEKMNYVAGVRAGSSSVGALVVGEFVIHGWDIAQALNLPWRIGHDEALVMARGAAEVTPMYIAPGAADFRGTIAVKLRGGLHMTMRFADGAVQLTEGINGPADCRIWADPVTFVLTSYGRSGRWGLALTGKVMAYGRRPWLGLRLPALIRNP
jgi:uncharacterized protein (TIGR03083 family)